ncbi:MAG: transglycosylase SLT domain-containing protein [Acidobacteria bacterium]|nr:transglycosylase SLT domain-containing protein [Acidobacteriota bacterium]
MGFDEKIRFVSSKSDEILALFGRTEGDQINAEGLQRIRQELDSYLNRLRAPRADNCYGFGKSDLTSVMARGSRNAAMISEEYKAQNIPSQVGLYTAMIESEFCPCLQSSTGPLGMFQFTKQTGTSYGLKTIVDASPENPDERCTPKLSARASAMYYKQMIAEIFGRDSVGIPLAIGAFNRGVGTMKKHIVEASALTDAPRISFWVLMDTQNKVYEKYATQINDKENAGFRPPGYFSQFQRENIKYVPKFFAAAIIGENPKAFGLDIEPLSKIK